MKIVSLILVLMFFLVGCGEAQVFEPVEDVYASGVRRSPSEVMLALPEEAGMEVIAGSSGRIYLCEGYTVTVETRDSGNIDATLQAMTGYRREVLTVLQRQEGDVTRYECAWTCAGEDGDQVARGVVLDDGVYHYCVCVMADARESGSLQDAWQQLLSSVNLRTD